MHFVPHSLSSFSEFNTCFTCAHVVDDSQSSKNKSEVRRDDVMNLWTRNTRVNKFCCYLRLKGIFVYFSIKCRINECFNLSRNLSFMNRWICNGKETFLMAVKINNNNNVWMGKVAHIKPLIRRAWSSFGFWFI